MVVQTLVRSVVAASEVVVQDEGVTVKLAADVLEVQLEMQCRLQSLGYYPGSDLVVLGSPVCQFGLLMLGVCAWVWDVARGL
jgi:hypothetical protein